MKTKISNFIFAKRMIEILCHIYQEEFIDIDIVFEDELDIRFENNTFYLNKSGSLGKTIFSIVYLYLKYLTNIPDDIKANISKLVFALVRNLDATGRYEGLKRGDIIPMKLNQHPIIWILMKDIICPFKKIKLKNTKIAAGKSGMIDAAIYIKDISEFNNFSDVPFVFLNMEVENESIRSAFLLLEIIRDHIAEENDAESFVRELFTDITIKSIIIKYIKMVFSEQEEKDFFSTLAVLCKSEEMEKISNDIIVKESQASASLTGNWWALGLTEKMLDPARGPDWTVHETWKSFLEDLWKKVESVRRERGLDEVPFETLLRIQSEEFKTDETKTLQELLANDRIW